MVMALRTSGQAVVVMMERNRGMGLSELCEDMNERVRETTTGP